MEAKKGDILNQMAIISDLLEKMNLESTRETTVLINLDTKEYNRILKTIKEKTKAKMDTDDKRFIVHIGLISFIFILDN